MDSLTRRTIEKVLGWKQRAGRWYNGDELLPKGYPENLDFANSMNDALMTVNKLKEDLDASNCSIPYKLEMQANGLFVASFLTPRGPVVGPACKTAAHATTEAALIAALDNRFDDWEWQ